MTTKTIAHRYVVRGIGSDEHDFSPEEIYKVVSAGLVEYVETKVIGEGAYFTHYYKGRGRG